MRAKRVSLTVKLTPGKDDDLIAWWESISTGKRQTMVKSILRDYMARDRAQSTEDTLTQIGQDMAWLREKLTLLFEHGEIPVPQKRSTTNEQLSNGETTRREKRIARATW